MDKQTSGTTIRIEAREKLNDGQPHTIEVKSGKVPFMTFTIEKEETAIHIPIDMLFDTIASNLRHFEIAATASHKRSFLKAGILRTLRQQNDRRKYWISYLQKKNTVIFFKMPSKEYRINNPLKYSFQTLKDNAKRRGKEFKLTFNEFKKFAIKTDYLNKKGISAQAYHIDRIDEAKGYTVENIRIVTNSENVKKYIRFKYRDQYGAAFETVIIKKEQQQNQLF